MRKKVREAQERIDRGLPLLDGSVTVGQLLDQWLETSAKPTVRHSTYRAYESHCRLHIGPALGGFKLVDLTPQHVQAFVNDLAGKGLHPTTISRVRATLRRALNQAMRWDLVSRNVATLVDLSEAPKNRVVPLTVAQCEVLLEALRGERLEAFYVTILALGLRSGEARALRWEDVDFESGTMHVLHSLQRIDGQWAIGEPKSESSVRDLPMPGFVLRKLRSHRARQNQERLLAGDRWQGRRLVFASTVGTPLDPSNVLHRFHRILEDAGLPKKRLHDLRHTTASLMAD